MRSTFWSRGIASSFARICAASTLLGCAREHAKMRCKRSRLTKIGPFVPFRKSNYGFNQPPVAWIGGAVSPDLSQAARAVAYRSQHRSKAKPFPSKDCPDWSSHCSPTAIRRNRDAICVRCFRRVSRPIRDHSPAMRHSTLKPRVVLSPEQNWH